MFQKYIHKVKFYPSAVNFTQALRVTNITSELLFSVFVCVYLLVATNTSQLLFEPLATTWKLAWHRAVVGAAKRWKKNKNTGMICAYAAILWMIHHILTDVADSKSIVRVVISVHSFIFPASSIVPLKSKCGSLFCSYFLFLGAISAAEFRNVTDMAYISV